MKRATLTATLTTILTVGAWTAAALPTVATEGFGPCDDEQLGPRAECGTVTVPERPDRPDGRTIDLRVVVLRADQPGDRAPVFLLAGGPGQAGSDLAGLALGPFAPVLESRDFVLVDQRGTGASNGMLCHTDSAERPQTAFDGLFDPDHMKACLEEISERADVRYYSTPYVVEDLELVRKRLGYDRVILWGGSGGTRTALVWMREHPGSVAAAAIDGITPTSFRAPSGMARAAQDALDRVFADCAAQESCAAAYPKLEADFAKLLWLFESGPVATHVTREDGTEVPVKMSRGDLGYAVRGLLYNARRAATLPGLIHHAATTGDVSAFAQTLWMRDINLRPVVSMGVHFAVYCSEDMPFIDPEEAAELNEGTFLGDYLMEQYGAICDFWPAEPVPAAYLEPTRADVPTLIFSGWYDPSTPASLGEEVARHLPNSRHVVVRNEAHGSGFGCGRELEIEFLKKGSLEGLGAACEDVGPLEFEVEDPAPADDQP